MGLQAIYRGDESTKHVIRKIMALPLLPANHIAESFNHIANSVRRNDRPLQKLIKYVRRQWITSTVHSLDGMSVHGLDIRTNNDCDGYHNRLRHLGQVNMTFYKLVEFIHKECKLVEIHIQLVHSKKLSKYVNNVYKRNSVNINNLILTYRNNNISVDAFLLRVSYLINPANEFNDANVDSTTDTASD